MKIYRTEKQEKRWKRDTAIYAEYHEAMANPLNSASAVAQSLMEKYEVKSEVVIRNILKRVERTLELMKNEEENHQVVESAE